LHSSNFSHENKGEAFSGDHLGIGTGFIHGWSLLGLAESLRQQNKNADETAAPS
jgi:hypothetical protein